MITDAHTTATTAITTRLRNAEVAVLMGGRSGEREISLLSGAAVSRALRDRADGLGPARVHDVEISTDGAWVVGGRTCSPEEALVLVPRDTVWFLALHGGAGEDGTIQGLFRATGRVHTGSGVGASALCMSKSWTRDVLQSAGIAVARGLVVDAKSWRNDRERILAHVSDLGPDGVAVKPDRGGSSVATSLVRDPRDVPAAIERALAVDERAVVEACIRGVEATCGVIGTERAGLRALTPVEIVPKQGRFFDYEEKYSATGAEEHCPPISISSETCARLREIALRAFRATGCEGYARVDFMIPRCTSEEKPPGAMQFGAGQPTATQHAATQQVATQQVAMPPVAMQPGAEQPIVLELNTLPGMTARSLLPRAAAEGGLSYRELCLEILRLALERDVR